VSTQCFDLGSLSSNDLVCHNLFTILFIVLLHGTVTSWNLCCYLILTFLVETLFR
jgi:hypothetical protein